MSYQSSNFRSPKLLKTFKYAPICFGCGNANDGTVVAAHANWGEFGKAAGLKAQDWAVAGLCYSCHSEIDQGSKLSYQERKDKWMAAWIKTTDWLYRSKIVRVA